ncbi:MAG: isoniazid response ATPase/transcriptional regulator IniR [Mycobacterium sp.]
MTRQPEAPPSARSTAELVPAAADLVRELATNPSIAVKVLVSGGIGTGKSTVLAAVRATLRNAGVVVHSRPSGADGAVVIDDAHLLGDDELTQVTRDVADPVRTVIVAAEPRRRPAVLRDLMVALERENPPVRLGALAAAGVGRQLPALDAAVAAQTVRTVLTATAGLPFLVAAARDVATEPDQNAVIDAARYALIDRLRRVDEPVLNTLLVTSISLELGPDDVAAALGLPADEAQLRVDTARASGLLEPAHPRSFLASVHAAAAQILGTVRHHDIEISLLRSQLALGTLSGELAMRLGEHGLRDDGLARALADLAAHSADRPVESARLYRAAARAGSAGPRAPLADALALTGDLAAAGRLADELLVSEDSAERGAAVRIAASIAAQDGNIDQAAELFRWLGPHPDPDVTAAAAVVSVACGDPAYARTALDAETHGPPTSTARAARSLAEGVLLTLDAPYGVAVSRLSQAITIDAAPVTAPDSPAALVALAALHGGDPVRARSVLGRALAPRPTSVPDTVFARRHRLLLAWVKMQDGQLTAATADINEADDGMSGRRDALWAHAARTGIARRVGDGGAMQKHWYAAMEVLAEYSVDLFALLPLAEVWVAAARLRQVDQLRHTLDRASDTLAACGNPVLWSVPLHWAGVHAGILANAPAAVAPHGQALTAAASRSAFGATLAVAGRTWLKVLANQVDADEVAASARALARAGLTWDATRLASQAALHATDGRVSGAMLQLARDLKLTTAGEEKATIAEEADQPGVSLPTAKPPVRPSRAPVLSDREREVAELLLLGLPYRDIGAQLFISAKTVEHHVARIRRRLGAESRSEMLSMLRTMLAAAT